MPQTVGRPSPTAQWACPSAMADGGDAGMRRAMLAAGDAASDLERVVAVVALGRPELTTLEVRKGSLYLSLRATYCLKVITLRVTYSI